MALNGRLGASEPRLDPIPRILMESVEGEAMDLLARDEDALVSPSEPILKARVGQVLVPSYHQKHDIMNGPGTEPILEGGITLLFSSQGFQSRSWLKPCSSRGAHSGVAFDAFLKMLDSQAFSNSIKQY